MCKNDKGNALAVAHSKQQVQHLNSVHNWKRNVKFYKNRMICYFWYEWKNQTNLLPVNLPTVPKYIFFNAERTVFNLYD